MLDATKTNELVSLTPNLRVDDVDATVEFYQELGFALVRKVAASGSSVWAQMKWGTVSLMFQSRNSLEEEFPLLAAHRDGGALTLWIQATDITALFRDVEKSGHILKPLGKTEYNGAMEFVMVDPNGFILHFSDLKLALDAD